MSMDQSLISMTSLNNGNFVLAKLIQKNTEYRYVTKYTGVEEYDEAQVMFCKICDNLEKNQTCKWHFFLTWDQIIKELHTSVNFLLSFYFVYLMTIV